MFSKRTLFTLLSLFIGLSIITAPIIINACVPTPKPTVKPNPTSKPKPTNRPNPTNAKTPQPGITPEGNHVEFPDCSWYYVYDTNHSTCPYESSPTPILTDPCQEANSFSVHYVDQNKIILRSWCEPELKAWDAVGNLVIDQVIYPKVQNQVTVLEINFPVPVAKIMITSNNQPPWVWPFSK